MVVDRYCWKDILKATLAGGIFTAVSYFSPAIAQEAPKLVKQSISKIEFTEKVNYFKTELEKKDASKQNALENEIENYFKKANKSLQIDKVAYTTAVKLINTYVPKDVQFTLNDFEKNHAYMVQSMQSALLRLKKSESEPDLVKKGELLQDVLADFFKAEDYVEDDQFYVYKKDVSKKLVDLYSFLSNAAKDEKKKRTFKRYSEFYLKKYNYYISEHPFVKKPKTEPVIEPKGETTEAKEPEGKVATTESKEEPVVEAKEDPVADSVNGNEVKKPENGSTKSFKGGLESIGILGGDGTSRRTGGNVSLSSNIFDGRYHYDNKAWHDLDDNSFNQINHSAYLQAKTLGIDYIAKALGLDIMPFNISAAYDNHEKRERKFKTETIADANFEITADTATKITTKEEYLAFSAKLAMFGLALEAKPFWKTTKTETELNSAVYVTNLSDPNGNYAYPMQQTLESSVSERGLQTILSYYFNKKLNIGEKEILLKGDVGFFGDYQHTRTKILSNKQNLENTVLAITAKAMISDFAGFNVFLGQEYYNGPGKEKDGWRNNPLFASFAIRTPYYEWEDADAYRTDDEPGKLGAALFGMFWYMENKLPAGGGGVIVAKNKIDINHLNNSLAEFGRTNLGLRREMGYRLSEFEQDKIFRNLLVKLGKGPMAYAFGWAFKTRDSEKIGAGGQAGFSIWKTALTANYLENHINRRIGGYLHADFDWIRLFLGFSHEKDKQKKHDSKTLESGFLIPWGSE